MNHHARNAVLVEKATQLLAAMKAKDATLRVLGGLGIYLKCPEFQLILDEHREPLSDIDLIGRSKDVKIIDETLLSLGYIQNTDWKMLFGYQRRIFYTPEEITIEVYLDKLYLCQEVDLRARLDVEPPSLSSTDLFLSRIQRIKLLPKDLLDLSVLVSAKELGVDKEDAIDLEFIASLAGASWPWWKTLRDNLSFLMSTPPLVLDPEPLQYRLRCLFEAIEQAPKSIAWRLRALVGSRMRWYADVE